MNLPQEIDFCVAMQGPNVDVLSRIFFKSMRGCISFSDGVKTLNLHVVDNGIPESHLNGVKSLLKLFPEGRVFLHDVRHKNWKLMRPGNRDVSKHAAPNTAAVCEWMLDNCGMSQWCIISHFDIMWKLDMVQNMAGRLTPHVGMLGKHDPMMLVNREAWRNCRTPLSDFADFFAVPGKDRWRVHHRFDRRAQAAIQNGVAINVGGFDVAELLELTFAGHGWVCESLDEEFDAHLYHFRSGSGYHGDAVNRYIRATAMASARRHNF